MRKILFPFLSLCILSSIYAIPACSIAFLMRWASTPLQKLALFILAPAIVVLLFILIAGLWSMPFHRNIVSGKFPRDLNNPVYFGRRIYGLCWTTLYYCTPIYFLCLSFDLLKYLTFRIFGYRGPMNFCIYPDTWIRDLPLLYFGDGAYLSNKATVGTNIALSNGYILVDRITLESGAYLGHLSMLASGVCLGEGAEIGVGCGIGIKSKIGARSRIGPLCGLEHAVVIGTGVAIGSMSYVGTRSRVGDGLSIPAACCIPPKTSLQTQADVRRYVSSATSVSAGMSSTVAVALTGNEAGVQLDAATDS